MLPRARFAALMFNYARSIPPLVLPAATSLATTVLVATLALAQPPLSPSTVAKPAPNPFGAPPPPPDPPQITPAELQTLTGGPTLVTLGGADLPLVDVTLALAQAGGLTPQPPWGEGADRKLSLDWKAVPFWSAAAQVETLSGQKWDSYGESLGLSRNSQLGLAGPSLTQSAYLTLVAQSLTRTSLRTLSFAPKTPARVEPDRVQLEMVVYFDPKLRVQECAPRALKIQKQGEAAVIAAPDNRVGQAISSRSRLISPISLALPPEIGGGAILTRLSGVLHTVLVSASQTLAVPDLVAARDAAGAKPTRAIGPHRYVVEGAAIEGDQLGVRLSAAFGAEAPRDRNLLFSNLFASVRVRDGAGHELERGGSSSTYGGPTASGNFKFNLKDAKGELRPGPYSLEWNIATDFKSLDVPFELRDVVVP